MKKVNNKYINIIIIIVKSFIERNKRKRNEIQDCFIKKNKISKKRHERNVIKVKNDNEKLEKETQEREIKKYNQICIIISRTFKR